MAIPVPRMKGGRLAVAPVGKMRFLPALRCTCVILINCFAMCGQISELDTSMNIPEWFKPAFFGAVAGAAALAFVGFSYGGWVTGSGAEKYSVSKTAEGVALALAPYCVARSKSDPAAVTVLAELKAATGYNRRGVLERAGWATPAGADKPNPLLAAACEAELGKSA